MSTVINEVSKRYGKLTVLSRAKNKRGAACWVCRCDCGNKFITRGRCLRRGETKTCGCSPHNQLPKGKAAFNQIFGDFKRKAKKRGRVWALSEDQVRELTKQNCFYCDASPSQSLGSAHTYNGNYLYNGIDRVDNTKGYIDNNVVPCCGKCNMAKYKMSIQEFKSHILKIYEHFVSPRMTPKEIYSEFYKVHDGQWVSSI